nr:MAG: RNA-dependent RNA polymerase [Botourmiaviridae sp.]
MSSLPCQQIAACPAPEGCQTFLHSVRSATIRAVSFIEKFFKMNAFVVVPPVNGTCTDYISFLKKQLDSCLITCMDGKFPPGVCESDYLSFSASIASIPKSWPNNCDCMVGELESSLKSRLTKEKIPLPAGYLEFVFRKVNEIFPRGMRKKDLDRHAARVTPPYSSTTTSTRREGGSYSSWRNRREDYLKKLEKPELVHEPCYMVAPTPGKPRPLVKNHPSYLLLRPVHTFLYDRLSRTNWLLRGPPSKKAFATAGFTEKSKYLSADFSAATDNISIEVAETIIDALASRSSSHTIPLLSEVKKSLRPIITMPSGDIEPTTGQLMGNLCSFPLLCLQNMLAVEWTNLLTGESVPFLVNGDDLVAQASENWVNVYRSQAPLLGFSLNEKKTSYSTMPNINSTYFTSRFKEIPFIRAKGLRVVDPRQIGKVMNDIKRPYERTRHSRLPRLVNHLIYFFSKIIRYYGLTLFNLGFRVRSIDNLVIDKKTRHYEKYRSGHTHKIRMNPPNPMGLNLVQASDPYKVYSDEDVANAVVEEHWNGPAFEMVKEKMWEVKKQLKEDKKIYGRRWKKLGMKGTMARLVREKKVEKLIWIPERLADCLTLSHDRLSLLPEVDKKNNEIVIIKDFSECKVCERVEKILLQRRQENRPADWRLDVPTKYTALLSDVQSERNRLLSRVDTVVDAMVSFHSHPSV